MKIYLLGVATPVAVAVVVFLAVLFWAWAGAKLVSCDCAARGCDYEQGPVRKLPSLVRMRWHQKRAHGWSYSVKVRNWRGQAQDKDMYWYDEPELRNV